MRPEQTIPELGEREFKYKKGVLWDGILLCVFGIAVAAFVVLMVFLVVTGQETIRGMHPVVAFLGALLFLGLSISLVVNSIAQIRRAANSKVVLYPNGFRWYDVAGKSGPIVAYDVVTRLAESDSGDWRLGKRSASNTESKVTTAEGEFLFSDKIDSYEELRDLFRSLAARG